MVILKEIQTIKYSFVALQCVVTDHCIASVQTRREHLSLLPFLWHRTTALFIEKVSIQSIFFTTF